jgi:hypothetical protein
VVLSLFYRSSASIERRSVASWLAAVAKNASRISIPTAGLVARKLSASTFASFHLRAPSAVTASAHNAARTPRTLFAAIEIPVPVQQADDSDVGAARSNLVADGAPDRRPFLFVRIVHGAERRNGDAALFEIGKQGIGQRAHIVSPDRTTHSATFATIAPAPENVPDGQRPKGAAIAGS